jgi:endonuclease/exonuclease/phosphatase family metal-dependent hydrolase
MDNITDYKRVSDIISRINPQVIAIQELDSATQRSNGAVVLNELADRTKMYPVYGASINYQGGKYGIGVLSKEKPIGHRSVKLPGREESRSILIVEFRKYIFCCTHFSLTAEDRLKSVEIINSLFKDSEKPVFLAGDLNATSDSKEIISLTDKWNILTDPAVPTIPSDNPRKCIDYILLLKNEALKFSVSGSTVGKEPLASDHLPVWVSITLKR